MNPSSPAAARPRPASRRRWLNMSTALAGYVVGRSLMLARSGLPQVADFAMLAMFTSLRPPDLRWVLQRYLPLPLLVFWVAVVNSAWASRQWTAEYLVFSSYYLFNLFVFTLVARTWIRAPELTRERIHQAVPVALTLQAIVVYVDDAYRAIGTFNNPNQLAYFGICALALYMLTAKEHGTRPIDFLVVGLVAWLEMKSLSRAGMGASVVLFALWFHAVIRSRRARVALAVAAAVVVALVLVPETAAVLGVEDLVDTVSKRINSRLPASDELALRNVERIQRYSAYTILGAGEGDLERFAHVHNIEIHSTLGTLAFSYGFIGLGSYLGFLWLIVRRVPRSHVVYLLALLLYSLTHNGLRFTYGWLVLGVLAGIGEVRAASATPRRPRPPGAG